MKNTIFLCLAASLLSVPMLGCGDATQCKAYAEHLADVLTKEKGGDVPAERREKMIKKTVEGCAASAPSAEVLTCAMAAQTSKAMLACEKAE